jgi:hypothetical protein
MIGKCRSAPCRDLARLHFGFDFQFMLIALQAQRMDSGAPRGVT